MIMLKQLLDRLVVRVGLVVLLLLLDLSNNVRAKIEQGT